MKSVLVILLRVLSVARRLICPVSRQTGSAVTVPQVTPEFEWVLLPYGFEVDWFVSDDDVLETFNLMPATIPGKVRLRPLKAPV